MSLKARAVSGMKWMASSMAVTVTLNLTQTVILSRLLQPRDFGLAGMAWVHLGLLEMMADAGVSNAIVHRQEATRKELSSLYWLTILGGCLVAAIVLVTAPLVVGFYHEPALAPLMPWLAVNFIISAVGQPFRMMMQRDLMFKRLARVDIAAATIALATSTVLALSGQGVMSLVLAGLAATTVKAGSYSFMYGRQWRPSLELRLGDLRKFGRWGALQLTDRTANYVASNVDYLMVGRFLGAEQLGVYRLAFELVVRPVAIVNPIVNSVAFPVFARLQRDNAALRRGVLEIARLISNITFPAMLGLLAVAPVAVRVVFGEKWLAAVPLVQIMCIMGMLRSLSNPVGSLLIALGRVGLSCFWNATQAICNTVLFFFVAQQGVVATAWLWAWLFAFYFLVSWKSLYLDTIQMRPLDYARAIACPTCLSLVMAGVVAVLYGALRAVAMPDGLRLAVLIASGIVVYAAGQWFFNRDYLRHVLAMLVKSPGEQVGEASG